LGLSFKIVETAWLLIPTRVLELRDIRKYLWRRIIKYHFNLQDKFDIKFEVEFFI